MGWAMQRGPRPWPVPRLASCVIVSVFRAVLDLDTYPISTQFVHSALNGLNLVEVSQCLLCMLAFSLFRLFSRHIFRTLSFQQNTHIFFLALVAQKLLVSLISRLVACSAGRPTDTQTNKYCNPRFPCAPRVNCKGYNYRDCIKRTRGKTRIYSILNDIPGA